MTTPTHSPAEGARSALQRLTRRLHSVLGLALGVWVAVLGVSGALLSFGAELDAANLPHPKHAAGASERAPLGPILIEARREYGRVPVTIQFAAPDWSTAELWLDSKGNRRAYADLRTGELLGLRDVRAGWLGTVRALHIELLSGEVGHVAVGVLGLALVLMVASGVHRWWPRRRKVAASLRLRWPVRGARGAFDLHKLVGLVSAPLLVLAAVTGATLVFGAATSTLLGVTSPQSPVLAPRSGPMELLAADDWLRLADERLPGGRIVRLHLPEDGAGPVRIRKRLDGEVHPNGMSFVVVDPQGGVLAATDARRATWQERLLALRFPLHTGVALGLPGRILMVATGLGSAWLSITGLWLWALRRRRGGTVSPVSTLALPKGTSDVSA